MIDLKSLSDVVLFRGDATTAYRDPAAIFVDGVFHLFFTFVKIEAGQPFLTVATSTSRDLQQWSPLRVLTPRDRSLNFSSPGNVIWDGESWVLCLQTYPRPNNEKYANETARLWTMRSPDLKAWSEPQLLRVKGADVPMEAMGRMIDPFLLRDKDDPQCWWCFYKQQGVSRSWSRDLRAWNYIGHIDAGENACVIVDGAEYVLFHSPENGIGVKRSRDLAQWSEGELITLGQRDWSWAQGRLTAGFALDLRHDPRVRTCLLFFHGSGPEDERTMFDHHASIGLAWSDDLIHWQWPRTTT